MKTLVKQTMEIVDDFSTGQLKAYYVGHADQYIAKLSQSFDSLAVDTAMITFPDWVPASCALFAAASCLFKLCKKLVDLVTKRD